MRETVLIGLLICVPFASAAGPIEVNFSTPAQATPELDIIHLVPIAEAAGVTFMLHGHRTECPLHSTAPPQEEQARKAGFGDGVRWDEFFQSKRLHHIEIREDLERRERQLKLEKKAKAMVKRRDREAPP